MSPILLIKIGAGISMRTIRVALLVALMMLLASVACVAQNDMNATASNASEMNIVETAVAAGNFKTLVAAVQEAGLAGTLGGPGPFTVFAPTDEAFSKVPQGVLDALMANKTLLTAVLTYHVVPGEIMSSDLENGMSVKTVEGSDLMIKVDDQGVWVDNAKVIQPDINASNGVIHAIDSVILPPMVAKSVETLGAVAAAAGTAEEAAKKAEATAEQAKETAQSAEETAKQASETAQRSTPGFEVIFALAAILGLAFLTLGRRD
jgi:uncharacterized surface protein with fasciclin (FAS1) repeats